MTADQKRKRLNGACMVSYNSPEKQRNKRKNLGLVQCDLTMKSHIFIEWDGNLQRIVAKREQIGISWRQMRPFANFVHNAHHILADVLAIPQEIFGLDSLSEVLSYEVWNMHLLDNERDILLQFLPCGIEPNQVVQELLSGDNFHFGNPFKKWGTSLCSGNLHPDKIVNQEQHLKSDKEAYYSQLQNYHKDMIGFLIKLKQRWEKYKDPEKEIVHMIWRSKNAMEKRAHSIMNEFRVYDHDGIVRAISQPCSWGAEKKVHNDYRISSMAQGNEPQKRVLGKGFNKGKPLPRNLIISSDYLLTVGARPKKGDRLSKLNVHSSDGDNYMSYIKISKKRPQLVKSMKLSYESIQSSLFNCVLGDLNNIHVQPYEIFVKEEQKLQEHWLQLVTKDIPAAYANWKETLIQKHAMRNSLAVEMKDKSKPLVEDADIVSSGIQPQDQEGGLNDQFSLEDDKDSISRSPENQSLHNSYHSGDDDLNHLGVDSEKYVISKSNDASLNKLEYSSIMNSQDVPNSKGATFSSEGHAWQAVDMPHSYYDSSVTHEYMVTGLSLANPRVNEDKQSQRISLESDLHEDMVKELLQRQSNDGPCRSYQSLGQIDLLQSLFKRKVVNSNSTEQKRAGIDFQGRRLGDGQISSHFEEPLQTSLTLDQGQRRAREVYTTKNMSDNICSDGGRYLIRRQDPLSPVNITDRAVNGPFIVAPSGSHVNTGDFIGHKWFSADR